MSSPIIPPKPAYQLEFYANDRGKEPVRIFIDKLDRTKRALLLAALDAILKIQGKDVCESEHGKALGQGLYEFRLRGSNRMALRVYFHPHGDKIILLLAGYDKGRFGEGRREDRAIESARKNLADFQQTVR